MHSPALDRAGRVTAWRLLHGRLFAGAFLRHIGRGTPQSHTAPTLDARASWPTLSHVMLTCPVSQAVCQWFASIWTAISQQQPPPLHANDRRGPWQPSAELVSLWQRLRVLAITQLWAAYCTARSRPDRQMTPAHIATRVLAVTRDHAPRLAPGVVRYQAQGRGARSLAQGKAGQHDSGAVPAALVPWRRPLQPARGHGGATPHPLDSGVPSAVASLTPQPKPAGAQNWQPAKAIKYGPVWQSAFALPLWHSTFPYMPEHVSLGWRHEPVHSLHPWYPPCGRNITPIVA